MDWIESMETYLHTLNSSTARCYQAALEEFAKWYHGTYGESPDIILLTNEEVREWRAYLSTTRKLKATSVNLRLSAIKSLARFYGRQLTVKGLRQVQQPIEPLTGRELGRLLATVEGDRWLDKRNAAIIALMARAGLRVGEVVALDLEDVELNQRSGWALIRRGKGMKERRVPLSLEARKALAAYLEVRPERAGPALFVTKTGQRMTTRDIQRLVTAATQRARLARQVTPHTLRHTFATRFLRHGGDLATLRSLLGHASIATTSRYLHPDAARVQEMVEEL